MCNPCLGETSKRAVNFALLKDVSYVQRAHLWMLDYHKQYTELFDLCKGPVSVSVSFGNGAPPSLLSKLVDLSQSSGWLSQTLPRDADGAINYGANASILADFHVLDGLNLDIIFGEDLLVTVNAFVRHSTDLNEVVIPTSLYPGLATMGLMKKAGRIFCEAIGKQLPQTVDPRRERDIADSKEVDRYKTEKKRIKTLRGEGKRSAAPSAGMKGRDANIMRDESDRRPQ